MVAIDVFSILTNYFIHNDFDGYIALLNPQVYEAFVWRFKIPVKKLAVPGFSPPYIPVFISVEELKKSDYYKRIKKRATITN
jgi:hypothetical protein